MLQMQPPTLDFVQMEQHEQRDRTLATSELLTVGSGETASAIVKLPSRVQTLGGFFSHGVQQALVVTAAAAAAGVLAQSVTGVDASAR